MSFGVVIAAAGHGKRMGSTEKKQFLLLKGKPVLYHTVYRFYTVQDISEIVVVTSSDDVQRTMDLLKDFNRVQVVTGGEERQQSVYKGLRALHDVDYALIHDAARPFVSTELIVRLMDKARETGAVIPAVPVKDTIKVVNPQHEVISTPPRQSLWAVQTPQAFRLSTILEAHHCAEVDKFTGTDDSMLLERMGKRVEVVNGEYTNIKLTTPDDLKLGESILQDMGE